MPMQTDSDTQNAAVILGTPANPARDPSAAKDKGPKDIGAQALNDGLFVIVVCWLFLFWLAYSLRHHNI